MDGRSLRRLTGALRNLTPPRLIGWVAVLLAASGCGGGDAPRSAGQPRSEASHDSGFAAVQARGERVMGVDQYTSTHVFEPLPDGGRIALQRDEPDSLGTAQIRRHMEVIAAAFRSGDFSLPGLVHAREVPGTRIMAARREAIGYRVEPLPRGAAVRVQSDDLAAVRAIHDFLAFQREDHHAPAVHVR